MKFEKSESPISDSTTCYRLAEMLTQCTNMKFTVLQVKLDTHHFMYRLCVMPKDGLVEMMPFEPVQYKEMVRSLAMMHDVVCGLGLRRNEDAL